MTKKVLEIPLTEDVPAQKVEVIIGENTVVFNVFWNDIAGTWSTNVTTDDNKINLAGIVLRCGIDDLLEPYCVTIGQMRLLKNSTTDVPLTLSNIGLDYSLVFIIDKQETWQ